MAIKNIAVLVTAPAADLAMTQSALDKCNQLVSNGHHIDHIFFYFDAVLNASPDAPLYKQWNAFSTEHQTPLIACSTLADNRELQSEEAGNFEFAGLSEFYTRLHQCNELVNA